MDLEHLEFLIAHSDAAFATFRFPVLLNATSGRPRAWRSQKIFRTVEVPNTSQANLSGFGHPLRRATVPILTSLPKGYGPVDRSSERESQLVTGGVKWDPVSA